MDTQYYEFKTITFKNGKILEITPTEANHIADSMKKEEASVVFENSKGDLLKFINLREIAFIS